MKDGWKNKTMWTFIGGVATALAGSKFLKSNTAHDLAVKGLAGVMKLKSDTTYKYETIKEDAKDLLEDHTRKKTKLELSNSLSIQFDKVWILEDGVEQEIAMSKLQKGDVVISQTGSMIPINGEVVDGEAMINESSFTGEPLSKHVKKNDTVFAGTLVEEGKPFIRVRNLQDESHISNIVKKIDTNESLKASIQAKAEHLTDSIVLFSF